MNSPIHIWGRITSLNVRKVIWAAQECGLPFKRTEAYRALNPNALVPTLEDGDFVLWESNAIVRYLLAKYDTSGLLYPEDLRTRFRAMDSHP